MASFTLFFGGGEQQGWRRLLAEQGAAMSVSFRGLLRRMPKVKPYRLAERMAGEYPLLLDSGAHSFNSASAVPERSELLEFAERYETFVEANSDRPSLITEFDSVHLGLEWINSRRNAFYNRLDPAKFMPVWHVTWGLDVLRSMAARYEVIAVMATETTTGSNLLPVLQQIARTGVRLHGVALTKPDVLRTMPFTSAASTSWLSPAQYGDTIVWDGQQLHRYPRDYKDQARRQHKMLIERAGFDAAAIIAGDANETLRFTIWSWLQQAEAISTMRQRRGGAVPVSATIPVGAEEDEGAPSSATGVSDTGTVVLSPLNPQDRLPIERSERQVLPGIGVDMHTSEEIGPDGTKISHETPYFQVFGTSSRTCDHCYIADLCVQFRPGHACAYDIPVSAETAQQRKAIMHGLIEMQTQRVAFMRHAEERHGGYADPNLSSEMDRLRNLMTAAHEIEDDRDTFKMSVEARGAKATMLERIFGVEAPPRHGQVIDVDPLAAIEQKVSLHGE